MDTECSSKFSVKLPKRTKKAKPNSYPRLDTRKREVSLILNLDTEKISLMGMKLPCNLQKGECQSTTVTKAAIVWEPQTHCQLFELIRFDAFMVKYQERYWVETNAEWTSVQTNDSSQKIKMNDTNSKIAIRFEVYPLVERERGSLRPIRKTEYDDIYILYEYGFDMNTGKKTNSWKRQIRRRKIYKNKTKINKFRPYTI